MERIADHIRVLFQSQKLVLNNGCFFETASITSEDNETENPLNKLKEKEKKITFKFTFKNPSKFDQKNQQTNVRKITDFFSNATSSLISTTPTTHGKLRTKKSMYRKLPPASSYEFKKLTDRPE